jgi:two-component system sensor kinase FixL
LANREIGYMQLTQEHLDTIRSLSKDESAFEQLVQLFEAQSQQASPHLSGHSDNPLSLNLGLFHNTSLYRSLVQYLPGSSMFLFDSDLRYTFVSGTTFEQTDLMTSTYLGKRLRDFAPPEIVERDEPHLLAALEGKSSTVDVEYGGRYYLVHVVPIEARDGIAERGVVLSQDITERKLVEIALSDSEEQFKGAFESSPIGMALLQQDARWLHVNKEVERLTGYSEAELLTMSYHDVRPPDSWERDAETIQRLVSDEIAISQVEEQFVRKDGSLRWVLCSASVVRKTDGTPRHFVLQIVDIDQRKQMMVELERMNRELDEFAEVISHDLKAPLLGMESLIQQLQINANQRLSAKENELVHLILEEVRGMTALIDGVRRYSSLSYQDEERTAVDLNEVVARVIRIIAPLPRIQVTVANTLPTLTLDPVKIEQVFINLLSNAVKFCDKPTGRIVVGGVFADDTWKFSVSDNGPGIDAKDFNRVFQVSKKFDSPRPTGTSGIGLAVVRKIVESYGGRIWVASKMGTGSTFYFTLPVNQEVTE